MIKLPLVSGFTIVATAHGQCYVKNNYAAFYQRRPLRKLEISPRELLGDRVMDAPQGELKQAIADRMQETGLVIKAD